MQKLTLRRQRGAALLLVMIAVGITTILALSFLASQRPTAVVASNIDRKLKARGIAESALKMAIDYVNQNDTWRTDKTSGQWMSDVALDGGMFDLYGIDEADDDLSDDDTQAVTLTAIATYSGVTHRVSARVTPSLGLPGLRMMLVVANAPAPSAQDQAKESLFESWGYTVTLIDDGASLSTYVNAAAINDVAYISEEVNSTSVGTKLRDLAIGVVCEEPYLQDDFGFTTSNTTSQVSGTAIDISDNSHMITEGFAAGSLAIMQSAFDVRYVSSTLAPGVRTLADRPGTGTNATIMIADTGASLYYGVAASRRVMLPTGDNFDVSQLTADGTTILQRSLQWASGSNVAALIPTLLAEYDFDEQAVPDPTLVGYWNLDETIGAGTIYLSNNATIEGGSYIDAYKSTDGAYGGSNQKRDVLMVINATDPGDVLIDNGTIYGDVQVGSGANPSTVVQTTGGSTITGTVSAQASNVNIPTYDAPTGFGTHTGNQTYNGGSYTWTANQHFNKLDITGGAQVVVSGNIEVLIENMLTIDNGQILLAPGATLKIWAGHNMTISNGSVINSDTTRPGALQIIQFGNNRTTVLDNVKIAGTMHGARDITLRGGAEIFGNIVIEDDLVIESGAIHTDLATRPIGITPATIIDQTTRLNHGSVSGATAEAVGRIGNAFSFDGSDDYLMIPHHADYLLDAGSVSFFMYPTSLTGSQGLFSKDSAGFGSGGHLHIYSSGSRIAAQIQTTSGDPYGTGTTVSLQSSTGALSLNQWYHVLVTWGDGQLRLYLNGVLVSKADHLGGLGTTSGGSGNARPIVLGASATNSGANSVTPLKDYFAGRMDDVRIYDVPMDAAQALKLATGLDPGTRVAPGYVIADTSGYGSPLDVVIYDTSAITWIVGGGLQFTGDTVATSIDYTTKLRDKIEQTGEFTLETKVARAQPATTASPSQIIGSARSGSAHNFMLGQNSSFYQARVRDSATGATGKLSPELISTTPMSSLYDTHLVLSYKQGLVKVYVDGVLDETGTAGGILDNWASNYLLTLGGAYGGGSHWRGAFKRVTVYDRGMSPTQAENLYNGKPPGPGDIDSVGVVVWDEPD